MRLLRRLFDWTLHVLTAVLAMILFALVAVLALNLYQQHRARVLIETVRSFRPGQTRASEVIQLARRIHGASGLRIWTNQFADLLPYERLGECERSDCSLSIDLQLPGPYVNEDWFSNFNRGLQFRVLRYLPLHMIITRVDLKSGFVSGVAFVVESHDDQPFEAAEVTYMPDSAGLRGFAPWSIYLKSGVLTTSGWGGSFHSLNVSAHVSVPFEQVNRVSAIEQRCFSTWAHCSACEMMRAACHEYWHGSWYYFSMPDPVLVEFRDVVNGFALGTRRSAIVKVLGTDHHEPGQTKPSYESLPFWFPESAVSNASDLTYYARKARERYLESPKDRYVTFLFDDNDRLVSLRSNIEGIRSRP